MELNDTEYYEVSVACSNCGYTGNISIKKGTPITEEKCLHCKCKTLIRRY